MDREKWLLWYSLALTVGMLAVTFASLVYANLEFAGEREALETYRQMYADKLLKAEYAADDD